MLAYIIGALSGQYEIRDFILQLCAVIFVVVCCLPVHECAHAWMANKLGDSTGKLNGRISLNPLNHLSLAGTLMMFIVGFGYAKPVPVNIRNFKKRKQYFALTALAGPVSNLILALFFSFIASIFYFIIVKFVLLDNIVLFAARSFFIQVAYINVALAVFNFLPFPPLDGSRIATMFLPDKIYYKIMAYERYLIYVLFALIFLSNRIGFSFVGIISGYIFNFFVILTGLPFNLFL